MTLCPATKGHCECQPEVSVYCPENLYIAYLQAEVAALRRQIIKLRADAKRQRNQLLELVGWLSEDIHEQSRDGRI